MNNNLKVMMISSLFMTQDSPLLVTQKPRSDLLNEYKLIKKKISKLSANKRRAIVRAVEARA